MPLGGLLTVGSIGAGIGGLEALRRKSKFRAPEQPGLKELVDQATEAQAGALRGGIENVGQYGSQFLRSQIDAQRSALPDYFRRQQEALSFGDTLANRLAGGDAETRFTTEAVRAGQAARGLALSPASAIQEGLAVANLQSQLGREALGLKQNLTQFSAATPYGVSAFQPDVPSLQNLTAMGFNRAQSQLGVDLEAARTSREESLRRNAVEAQMFGKVASGLGGAAGGSDFMSALKGFGQGFGTLPTTTQSQLGGSQVGSTQGWTSQPPVGVGQFGSFNSIFGGAGGF